MLTPFDWLRRCVTGAELLATLHFFEKRQRLPSQQALGSPISALHRPCQRCQLFPQRLEFSSSPSDRYCDFCGKVLAFSRRVYKTASHCVVVFGFVPQLARQLKQGEWLEGKKLLAGYIHENDHFIVMMPRKELKAWLQNLIFHHGPELQGIFQIFPTLGSDKGSGIGELLNWALKNELNIGLGAWQVQFYARAFSLINPHRRGPGTLLACHVAEFLALLETAEVFRDKLFPHEQQQLYDLLQLRDTKEEQFYWGRFLGSLTQEAKDMLTSWRIRQWSASQVQLLYALIEYAKFTSPH